MSNSGVFRIIANDGKADRMIMATELLNQRIKDTMCMRAAQGMADPTPTLVDLERTHILFVNAHFKPFAAHGYEYFKQRSNTGYSSWDQTTQFAIPQYGDFFSDMAIFLQFESVSATPGTVPAFPARIGAVLDSATASVQISHTDSIATNTYARYTYEYVDSEGNVIDVGDTASNFVRYCEYPGERIFRHVKFEVNANPLDEYYSEAMFFRRKFEIQPNKLTGWKRLLGQEVPHEGATDLITIAGQSTYGAPITGLINTSGDAAPGAPTVAGQTARKLVSILNGPQTPKETQPELVMWVPLNFWFNKDVRLAVPSVSIPFGQRFITLDIEKQGLIVFTAPGNLFLRLSVEWITGTSVGVPGSFPMTDVTNYQKYQTLTPVLVPNSVVNNQQKITQCELYINNIFMNPEIHDIYIKRIGFTLIRVHLRQTTQLTTDQGSTQLSNLKWPIEYMYVGYRPTWNISPNNPNQPRDWHRLTVISDQVVNSAASAQIRYASDNTVNWSWTPNTSTPVSTSQVQIERVVYTQESEPITSLSIKAHGIDMYKEYLPSFYNAYLPFIYGANNLNTPEDLGAFFINFCFYPGTYNPSGHFNVSRAREFYIDYKSTFISSVNVTEQIVLVKAINFLLISDGSAVLRYST